MHTKHSAAFGIREEMKYLCVVQLLLRHCYTKAIYIYLKLYVTKPNMHKYKLISEYMMTYTTKDVTENLYFFHPTAICLHGFKAKIKLKKQNKQKKHRRSLVGSNDIFNEAFYHCLCHWQS